MCASNTAMNTALYPRSRVSSWKLLLKPAAVALLLATALSASAQPRTPIQLTGFNKDMIVERGSKVFTNALTWWENA